MRVVLAAVVAASFALGCGSAASAPASPAGGDDTSLRISFWAEGDDAQAAPKRWTLRCDPAGGSHPRDAEACRKLDALKQPFKAPRKDLQCTQQYGGPQEATVTGTYLGNRVFARLTLTDGCQIARFKRLSFLVPGFRVTALGS
jgi:hypothetical protein